MTAATDLLRVLDACVLRDSALPGIAGTLAVGVRGTSGERWWSATFGAKGRTEMCAARPAKVDASLLLGEVEARSLVELAALPDRPALFEVAGDHKLLLAFLSRYLSRKSWLDVRARRK